MLPELYGRRQPGAGGDRERGAVVLTARGGVGLLLPLILLLNASTRTRAVLIGVLALLGVLADKMWILVAGQEKPWLAVPTEAYFPTWVEFLVLIGVIGLGALAYNVLRLVIPPKEASV